MLSYFDEESQKILLKAREEMIKLKHPYVGSEHFLLAILISKDLEITKYLKSLGITYEKFQKEIIKIIGKGKKTNTWFLYTPLLKKIIENAMYDSRDNKESFITVNRLFLSLLDEGEGVAIRILLGMNIDIEQLYNNYSNKLFKRKKKSNKKLLVEEYGLDFTKLASMHKLDPVIGREKEIEKIIEILARKTKNNPLLIGEAGVGKTAIVEGLALKIVNKEVPDLLQNKRIISLSMSSLVAGTKYRGEFEERINNIIKELEHVDNIILFVDEIHTLLGAGGAEGAIDAANILKPYLARNKIKIIGATTIDEYLKFVEKDSAFDRRFQKIEVTEPTDKDLKDILSGIKDSYELYHDVIITNEIIDNIIKVSNKYIFNKRQPDKAIDVLDEACTKAILTSHSKNKKINNYQEKLKKINNQKTNCLREQNFNEAALLRKEQYKIENYLNKHFLELKSEKTKTIVTKEIVLDVIKEISKIDVSFNSTNNKLKELENKLKHTIKGQDKVITEIMDSIKIINSNYNSNRPKSFLFIGSTGVGKTMLVKLYAEVFATKNSFIRLDMTEYKEPHSVSKIIGSPPGYIGYDDNKTVLDKVRKNPNSIILLDEVEKADSSVLKLFLQILDEGAITDSKGRVVNFNNTVIFMTSNFSTNVTSLGFINNKTEKIKVKLDAFFSKEFINRIDKILYFNDLKRSDIKKIITNKLKKIQKEYQDNNIDLSFSTEIVDKIIKKSEYEKYGARRIDKIIELDLTNMIIDRIFNGETKIYLEKLESK